MICARNNVPGSRHVYFWPLLSPKTYEWTVSVRSCKLLRLALQAVYELSPCKSDSLRCPIGSSSGLSLSALVWPHPGFQCTWRIDTSMYWRRLKKFKAIKQDTTRQKYFHLLWAYSSPICGGYSSSQSTTSSSSSTTKWHSLSPRWAELTITGRISSSRKDSNWARAPSLLNSWSRPPTWKEQLTNLFH